MSVKAWEHGPSYIDMPSGMETFSPPAMPEPETVGHLHGAREAMQWLQAALKDWQDEPQTLLADLGNLDAENRELVNQILGVGEVSVVHSGSTAVIVQESVLAGVWRTLRFAEDGRVSVDLLEVAQIPGIVLSTFERCTPIDTRAGGELEDFANALPLLVEIAAAIDRNRTDGTEHSINLTLLPMSPEELDFIDKRLGRGPIDILSGAYGKCQVISTQCHHVWWVRYYNSMGKLILNTLEITAVPQVVAAAPEDLADSAVRLTEILDPYWPDIA